MTSAQLRTLLIFSAILGLMFVGIPAATLAWDLHLKGTAPDGVNTISWVMTLLCYAHPAVAFLLGSITGNFNGIFLVSLPLFHWLFGMPDPKIWDELQSLRAEVKRLRSQVAKP